MNLKGWVRTSLIDYDAHIATVLFTGGCNFRCPMCHNADLVLRPEELPSLPAETVWRFLARRRGLVDGVVITGGEPTLQTDLIPFLQRLHEKNLDVKLDTNGYRPEVLSDLLRAGVVDYVAMDVKAPPGKYAQLAGIPHLAVARIDRSIDLLKGSAVPYEFRTTVAPGLLDGDDVEAIARWIAEAARYTLQQFRPVDTLDPTLDAQSPYPNTTLQTLAQRAEAWVPHVDIRGV